jgi:RNA polymerase sigma-54 factor
MGANREAKDYITERLRSAQWLIRSIQQRQRTILKVAEHPQVPARVLRQGPEHLKPLILKDVAEDIRCTSPRSAA